MTSDPALTALLRMRLVMDPQGNVVLMPAEGTDEAGPQRSPSGQRRNLVPLAEFLRQRLGPIGAAPRGDLRLHLQETNRQQPEFQAGVSRLLEGLRAPLFPLPGAHRVGVPRLTDAEPVYRQHMRSIVPSLGPRPGELVTPGENRTLGEIYRILDLHRQLEERGGVEPGIAL